VLKDAASAAIYGARAANGVVLVTTKKGTQDKLSVSYEGYYGIQNAAKKLDMLSAQEYMMIMNEANTNMGSKPLYSQETMDTLKYDTDWMDYLFNKNVPQQSHTVSLEGGNDKSIFSTSLSYTSQEGIVGTAGKSKYERISARINSEHKVYKDKVKIGESFIYSHALKRGVGVGNIYANTVREFLNASPLFPAYDTNQDDGFGKSWAQTTESNPLAAMYYNNFNRDLYDKLLGNIYSEIEIVKGLKFNTKFGIDLNFKTGNSFVPTYVLSQQTFKDKSSATMEMSRDFSYNFENYLTYDFSKNKHTVSVLAGNTIQEYFNYWVKGVKEDLIIQDFDFAILDNATNDETVKATGSKKDEGWLSYFGRLNYNYAEKYMATATIRRDGSTKFGPDNRFGVFPSFSAGWVITNEDFFSLSQLEFLKLRASWGKNGNDKIPSFSYISLVQSTQMDYYFGSNDVKYVGSAPVKAVNPKIKWEQAIQTDIGLDARFLEMFTFSFDWYKKTTSDWLVNPPVLDAIGVDEPAFINGGEVENKGIEIDLGFQKNFGGLNVNINANLATNSNEVTYIEGKEGVIHGQGSVLFNGTEEFYRAEIGYPIGYFYGFKTDGIFQNQAEVDAYSKDGKLLQKFAKPGDVRFVDVNNDGVVDTKDKTQIGDPHPDFTYGLSIGLDYKGFDFSFYLQGVHGNDVVQGIRINDRAFSNYTTDILGRWTGEGTSNRLPRVTPGNDQNLNYKRISDLYVEDGSYLKIRSINLGYTLTKAKLQALPIQSCRIYVSANNVLTFTKYSGLDPEIGYGDYDVKRYDNFSTGIDLGTYPQPRSVLFGLNVKF
jgi:TonB-dependent starch-binding outer membrane protein SusC